MWLNNSNNNLSYTHIYHNNFAERNDKFKYRCIGINNTQFIRIFEVQINEFMYFAMKNNSSLERMIMILWNK